MVSTTYAPAHFTVLLLQCCVSLPQGNHKSYPRHTFTKLRKNRVKTKSNAGRERNAKRAKRGQQKVFPGQLLPTQCFMLKCRFYIIMQSKDKGGFSSQVYQYKVRRISQVYTNTHVHTYAYVSPSGNCIKPSLPTFLI